MNSLEPARYARAVYDSLRTALKAEGHEDMLAHVLEELVQLARAGGPTSADVTSAVELSAAQRAKIEGELRGHYGAALDINYQVDSALLGGLLVRVGDKVLDTSVRQRLNAVQRNMIAG